LESTLQGQFEIPIGRWHLVDLAMPAGGTIYYAIKMAAQFDRFPSDVPIHFGFDGAPDGWMGRSAWAVVSLAVLTVFGIASTTIIPPPGCGSLATGLAVIFWMAFGLILGAFSEINTAAVATQKYRVSSIAIWAAGVPAIQIAIRALAQSLWRK
jgi:hypothetical protein